MATNETEETIINRSVMVRAVLFALVLAAWVQPALGDGHDTNTRFIWEWGGGWCVGAPRARVERIDEIWRTYIDRKREAAGLWEGAVELRERLKGYKGTSREHRGDLLRAYAERLRAAGSLAETNNRTHHAAVEAMVTEGRCAESEYLDIMFPLGG